MKKLIIVTGILIGLVTSIALGVGNLYVSGKWHYRMTVFVETPEGVKSGSTVREVSNKRINFIPNLPQEIHPARAKGEAVVVDLGKRGVLFALMSGPKFGDGHATNILYEVFPSGHGGSTTEGIKFYKKLKDESATILPFDYPSFVKFGDLNNPMTVQAVDAQDISKSFGEGVTLQKITIEIVPDEPITQSITKWLPWLEEIGGGYLHKKGTSSGSPLGLDGGDFIRKGT